MNQPDNSHDSTTTANNRRDKCTKKRCDNSDNKKETQLPDATTMQDRTMKNKCVIGDSSMRGLATQLKSKLTNPAIAAVSFCCPLSFKCIPPRLRCCFVTGVGI